MNLFEYFKFLTINYSTFLIINLILSTIVILLERKTPTAALAWLFFLNLVPGFGFFFYILLSQNISKRKIFRYTEYEENEYSNMLGRQFKLFESDNFSFSDSKMHKFKDLIMFHNRISHSYYSQNNNIDIFTNGEEKFKNLINDLTNAKDHIHMLYFIVKNDEISKKIFNILIKKSKEGIKIRLLVDYVGGRKIKSSQIRELKKSGIQFEFFFPSKLKLLNFKSNYRNHRKIVVIDGKIGYLGGFNIGDEYINKDKKFGFWRDTHLKFTGSAVGFLQIRFLLDWRNASKQILEEYWNCIKDIDSNGDIGMQIVSSGPDSDNQQIKQGYLKLINSAKKCIYIQSPYFIPDDSILEALKIASASGVDVKIMVPNKPDHPFVYWATYSYCGDLIPYGVNFYKYEAGFLHAKTIVVDGIISSVGTCNFDIRSFKLNFEVNAFIYNSVISNKLQNLFIEDLEKCSELTYEIYNKRSFIIKIKESISRLASPVL
jgi:cardiolipin synthase